MGDDQYGAELERHFPQLKDGLLDAFDAYLADLEGVQTRLRDTRHTYDAADQANQG
ncbi:hypothetical protein Misp01_57780 [Microtetraspora sp. NBRC 13810]|uniref:hypothetical protein n=1 Tax=Microtetraspora sp. NBRC 13810 TaxID=3030990 RepID=UPI0024A42681|nr:hypothetical protein [Microtetraspora sp. NBRC 13810]GLW10650.1 hypothetical protein Misp01_57780 [Microtetraspora sp. NBRC 13810]